LVAPDTTGANEAVGLGGVRAVVQPGPVNADEGEVAAVARRGVGGGLEEGLAQASEGDARVVIEAPGGLCGGLGGGRIGQDTQPGRTRMGVAEMFLDESLIAILETFFDFRNSVAHVSFYTSSCLCRKFRGFSRGKQLRGCQIRT